ncbi:hypothetical protein SLEP1_g3438 [Rubroshorea leprosula]|uniref:Uncharacterized protein n=1 Tax=Rubroshorea leprosula TaxID=152421 RepID=A0AAV5HUR7_9ROSI|nr:hypothetical protein SLEP1_g3438 [Rubroshorea leprosula]
MPPLGPMQSLNPNTPPAPGPPTSLGVFIPPFSPPVVWLGPRGIDMNMMGVPPGPMGRGAPPEKSSAGWVPSRTGGPSDRAPSKGEQNDYFQNFVDTGKQPQEFIRELELTNVVEDYPKLRELIQNKDEIVAKVASPPMYFKCDLHEFDLSPEFFETKFDVILIDPPRRNISLGSWCC